MPSTAATDLRFAFGANWRHFLDTVDADRVEHATDSLAALLGSERVRGRSFLDIGSGSGLSSLAALRLGASRIRSFDYDADSVACTAELRRRFGSGASWTVELGDALDAAYLRALGTFDVVYSWGVLHHTGAMWKALDNVTACVAPGGTLCVALYNDQGRVSRIWTRIKAVYNGAPRFARPLIVLSYMTYREARSMVGRLWRGETWFPPTCWREYRTRRGMSVWHDYVDWVGGYPFEVATPAQVHAFYEARGFRLAYDVTDTIGGGCNQFVFTRRA